MKHTPRVKTRSRVGHKFNLSIFCSSHLQSNGVKLAKLSGQFSLDKIMNQATNRLIHSLGRVRARLIGNGIHKIGPSGLSW